MFSRMMGVPVVVAAAVGVPYVATNGPSLDGLWNANSEATADADLASRTGKSRRQHAQPVGTPAPQGPGATLYPTATPLEGMPSVSLQEIFNLNVTREWVYQHWARKSTALSDLGMYGVRVPVVTGTQMVDLAGSLTYYFDEQGRARRISFRGKTGDTSQVVAVVAQAYGLQRQATPVVGEQLFQIRRGNDIFSELRTRPAAVLWASSPHDSFDVEVELQRGDVATPLPSRLAPVPSPPPAATAADAEKQSQTAKQAEKAKSTSGAETWDAFFPRSRVPNEQVDNLDRRNGMW